MSESPSAVRTIRPAAYAEPADEITLAELWRAAWRDKWLVAAVALVVAVIGEIPLLLAKPSYTATASFIVQGTESARSGLAGLAGQLGVALPAGGGQSPQFYADLLTTRELLAPLADARLRPGGTAAEQTFTELFAIQGATPAIKREAAVLALAQRVITTRVSKVTGVVTVSARSAWPGVSMQLVQLALDGLNGFTLRMRQAQAAADRRYSDERVRVAESELRQAENRLAGFMQSNRLWEGSPSLALEHDRLQRDVALRQQVFTAVREASEEARGREMRDTPVITLVDTPVLPASPDARGRVQRAAIGLMLGAALGFALALMRRPREPRSR